MRRMLPRSPIVFATAGSSGVLCFQRAAAASASPPSSPASPRAQTPASPTPQSTPKRPTSKGAVVFNDHQLAYSHLSLGELLRSRLVLRMCRSKWLVQNAATLAAASEAFFGRRLTYDTVVRWTFFAQFSAGVDGQSIQPTLSKLAKLRINPILDFAAEAEMPLISAGKGPATSALDLSMQSLLQRTDLTFKPDHEFEANAANFLTCIRSAKRPATGVAFVAMKLTGLVDPQLLARLSALLLNLRRAWIQFFTKNLHNNALPLESCRVVVGVTVPASCRFASVETVRAGLRQLFKDTATEAEIAQIIGLFLPKKASENSDELQIDYLRYVKVLTRLLLSPDDPTLAAAAPLKRVFPSLQPEELACYCAFYKRCDNLIREAERAGVRVMVDAEQTFYQMAIDEVVRNLQREHNTTAPVVYGTYQAYTTVARERLQNDLERARFEKVHWGGKLVRGAYLDQERETSLRHGYPSPIHPNKAETDRCYADCANIILQTVATAPNHKIGVCFGTHNEMSVAAIVVQERTLPEHNSEITFAQLLGMADHITVPLASAGYSTYKFVPYGPVKATMAYLIRRGQENAAIMENANNEILLLKKEQHRRFVANLPFGVGVGAVAIVLYKLVQG